MYNQSEDPVAGTLIFLQFLPEGYFSSKLRNAAVTFCFGLNLNKTEPFAERVAFSLISFVFINIALLLLDIINKSKVSDS